MIRALCLASLLLAGACTGSPQIAAGHAHGGQVAAAPGAGVRVSGPSGRVVILSAADLAALPHHSVTAKFHGKISVFEGVQLTALLEKVGAPVGLNLTGADLDHIVVVTARDGYRVALSLAETDASIRGGRIILADKVGGAALADADGPLRLVIEGDLKAARSARMVATIEVRKLD